MPWQANNNTMGAMRMPSQVVHQQGKDDAKDRVTVTLTILEAERCLPGSDPTSHVAFVSPGIPALAPFLSEGSARPCFMHAREHAKECCDSCVHCSQSAHQRPKSSLLFFMFERPPTINSIEG